MPKRSVRRPRRTAIAYLRASKDEQRLSGQAQRASIEAWATREGVRVAVWCTDQGVRSVSPIAERPGMRAALAALREHGAAVLVVARRDRIARDVVLAATVERAVTMAGARLVSASGEGNGDSPADAFIRTVIDGAAQYEHGLIRARTYAALAAKRALGERVGSVPFGFALDPRARASSLTCGSKRPSHALANFARLACRFAPSRPSSPPRGRSAARGGGSWPSRSHVCSIGARSHPSESPLTFLRRSDESRREHEWAADLPRHEPSHRRERRASRNRRLRAEPLTRLLRERARRACSLRVRPHSSDGNVLARRCWVGAFTPGRRRSGCRCRPGSDRAGVAGRLLDGGHACLICSSPTGKAPWTARSRARVDREGAEKRAAAAAQRTSGAPGQFAICP